MLTIVNFDNITRIGKIRINESDQGETRPRKRISEGCKFLQTLMCCLESGQSQLTPEELVKIAAKLSLHMNLSEAQVLMEQTSRQSFYSFEQDFHDSCHKVQVPGHTFYLKFFHLRVIAKRLAIERGMSSTEAISQVATMWEKVKSAMDLLQVYTTKWKRMKEGSLVSVKKPRVMEIMFLRHSQSESNLGWDLFKQEPFIFDPSLTMKGFLQSSSKSFEMRSNAWQPEIVVSSPLRRSIMTASITMKHTRGKCPWIIHPFCRELVSGADDIGTLKPDLMREFPQWNFELLPDSFWWYHPDKHADSLDAHRASFKENPWHESRDDLVPLIQSMFGWLTSLPCARILVASHGSYIERAINVKPFRNCQTRMISVDPTMPYVF